VSQVTPPLCDHGVVAAAPSEAQTARNGPLVLAGTVLGSSLAFIDGSAVNLTLPVIQQQLGGGLAQAQWIMNAYLLMLGALVLAGGAAADRYGHLRVFILGVGLFSAASLCCGLAPNLALLIAARAVQGVGAALLVPASLAILGASFDKAGRSQAVGIWAGAGGLTSALGLLLGGWLTDTVSWRAVFFINLPVAALAVTFLLLGARESRAARSGPLDWLGAVTVTVGLALVTWSLTDGPVRGFGDPAVTGGLVAGVAILGAFLWIERRAASPMLPLALFKSATFSGANALTLLLYGAFGGALFLLPFQLIRVQGYDATRAGAALLPLSVGLTLLSPVAGKLTARLGARLMLTVGPILVGAGFAILALTAGQASYWAGVFPGLSVLALGMGIAVVPLTDAVLGAVSQDYEGAASGVNNAVARVAGLLAIALVGFVLVGAGGEDGKAVIAHGYRIAMIAASVGAVAAGLIGWLSIRPPRARV
jgi:EmrB/QacA subfamily drug resistance transporter